MKWSLITATNKEEVLRRCLARSPCLKRAVDFNAMRGFASAAAAYNAGIHQSAGDILVFAHHDVYLPEEWDSDLEQAIRKLEQARANWAVLGVWGVDAQSRPAGHVYCNASGKTLGGPFEQPIECSALDEIVLILRRSTGVTFDEQLVGFDFYGTDVCLTAKAKGFKNYLIPAFCVHNPAYSAFYRRSYWRWYFFMRRKWRHLLPIRTPTTVISRWPLRLPAHLLKGAYVAVSGIGSWRPADDIEALYRQVAPRKPIAVR
ncbi:MAG TPA: glycosyltransferase [Candidatus Acidoferrum sp.]|nr:glycosyltransferase [Candidatus Acidoferrum sp.]